METPTKPYLERVDRGATEPLQWAKYLSETFGTSGALSSLRYYERIGWISPEARKQMTAYLRGLSLQELHNKKYDEPATLSQSPLETLTGTPFGAHARSLEFVAEIADHDLKEQRMLARIAEHRVENGQSEVGELLSDGGDDVSFRSDR